MSDSSTSIVPAAPQAPAITSKPDLSPAVVSGRLHPHKVIDLPDRRIFSLIKIGCAASRGERSALLDKDVPRQMATITTFTNRPTFQLSYWPHDGEAQIVKELPLSDLAIAVNELRLAGFD